MAVTQQLVRIPAERLAVCRRSVEAVDEVCSFLAVSDEDQLDLNWWPSVLKRVWELAGVEARTLALLRRAVDGDDEVNPAYRDCPDTIWQHPVTALEPSPVGEVADALRAVTSQDIRAVVPPDPGEVEAELARVARWVDGDLAGPLIIQHALLRDFYEEAAQRHLAVVLWWD